MAGGSVTGKQWQLDHSAQMGHTKVRFAVAMACACGLVYILFFALMSARPCWNTCLPNSCTPVGSPVAADGLIRPIASTREFSKIHVNLTDELLHPAKQSDLALMALEEPETEPEPEPEPELLAVNIRAETPGKGTDISRIVFGIAAAADMWSSRKDYVKLWWKPEMRGFVWLDKIPGGEINRSSNKYPNFKVSENTSHFEYTYKNGWRSAIRISRIVAETFRLGLPDVDWFVLGDDDTVFFPDNLVQVLSKYDHRKMYYIGSNSESHLQNILFSYNMAYGGGGFAITYPLVKMLAKIQDSCLTRYPHLFGSDDRMHACMAELGIPLTKELGFHQFDIHGDASGILAAHPVVPLVSMHHLDLIDPIFPSTKDRNYTRLGALKQLMKASTLEAASAMQQSICYDRTRKWSFTVSWGYVVQAYKGFITPRELEVPEKTFLSWHKETSKVEFPFNTRANPDDVCKKPTRFFMDSVKGPAEAGFKDSMESYFVREPSEEKNGCAENLLPLSAVQRIRVVREMTDDSWYQIPRRSCCRVRRWKNENIDIHVGACKDGETLVSNY